MLNIFVAGKIYNIQLGYEEGFDSKISLGTLHLGYEIERAFADQTVYAFDLLAGDGKTSNYKERIADPHSNFESIMIVRSPLLKTVFWVNDSVKHLRKKLPFYN
jgi:hypothetical protein